MSFLDEIKKEERKIYFRCAIAVVIGLVAIGYGLKLKGLFSNILVITGAIIVLITLFFISNYAEIIYKAKGLAVGAETGEEFKETYISWPPWIKKWGWLVFGLPVLAGFGWFGKMHENDFGGLKFVWHSLIAGILGGTCIFVILRLRFTQWMDNKNKSSEVAFYIILATTFVVVCFGPIVNKYFATAALTCQEYGIESPGKVNKKRDKYVRVLLGTATERFNPPRSFFRKFNSTDSLIILCVRKGGLGYLYVEEFKLPAK